jgi:SagB-type dehydrogenase family enzyme
MDALEQVCHYHQETKHHFFRYARALGYLDWANQPNPFRRYAGAPLIPLPILRPDEPPLSPLYRDLYSPRAIPPEVVSLRSLSRFFEYALALTAWKQAGNSRWALRSNPSSGNLHPTEGYLLMHPLPGLVPQPSLYHYAPKEHGLELRAHAEPAAFAEVMKPFPPNAFLVGFSSIHWREAWKYGERAFRYCQHDVGHAIGAARMAAATLGWQMLLLEDVSDDTLEALLGLNRLEDYEGAEREHPDCVAVVWPADAPATATLPLLLDQDAVGRLLADWSGRANRLSVDDPVSWDIIDDVSRASRKAGNEHRTLTTPTKVTPQRHSSEAPDSHQSESAHLVAGQIIRQRRSALAFDGKTTIAAGRFYTMLRRVMPQWECEPGRAPVPWDVWPWEPCIHLALFVHRVDGLAPGLYCLVRDPEHLKALQHAMNPDFRWNLAPECPADIPLFLLEEGDARRAAVQVSCHQDIAGDSAFSLGMIAEFESALQRHGPWFYRRLFWETGLIGQVLYLEAEAAGVRATGIGCFFDDPMHQILGLKNQAYQSLYHFTTGGHVDDPRLTTLPAYAAHAIDSGEPAPQARLSFP